MATERKLTQFLCQSVYRLLYEFIFFFYCSLKTDCWSAVWFKLKITIILKHNLQSSCLLSAILCFLVTFILEHKSTSCTLFTIYYIIYNIAFDSIANLVWQISYVPQSSSSTTSQPCKSNYVEKCIIGYKF